MTFEGAPIIGQWYRRIDRDQLFQVVAVDEHGATVEIEYFDGTVDEWPLPHWHSLEIEVCDEPPDTTGAYEQMDDEPSS